MAESKTKNNKSEFQGIWDNLYNLDISNHVNKKMDLDFLSWGIAYTLMVQNYPDFTHGTVDYDGCPYQKLPNGTAQVTTWVEINSVRREMTLPIMDNRMKSTTNLDATLVNKNVWRCFVKNCAMFGLGMKLYSQMKDDIEDIGNAPDKEEGAKPEALTPQEDGYPTDQSIDDLKFQEESGVDETIGNEPTIPNKPDTKESEMFMEMCLSYLKSENLSVKEIENFFPDNKDNFMRLKDEIPSEYNNLITMFKNKKKELQKGDK